MDSAYLQSTNADLFWDEMAADEHVLQLYENEEALLGALTGFVLKGLYKNESCIIIATDAHIAALETRLKNRGIDIIRLLSAHQYIPLNAEKLLSLFMINGWPEESLFKRTVSDVLLKARGPQKRTVRAFGEMVAILWRNGHKGATLQLENLWTRISRQEKLTIFCAYPANEFQEDLANSAKNICCAHTRMLPGVI